MLTVEEARTAILETIVPLRKIRTVKLENALNRILARTYSAEVDVPPAANSAMDGYAIDLDRTPLPANLVISDRITAGQRAAPLAPGTAARIFTGAEIPEGCNAVAIQENCQLADDSSTVFINDSLELGSNIRPQGQDIKLGSPLFSAGHRLRPQDVGLLASTGIANVEIYKKPTVAILCTGNELVDLGKPLKKGQIYNSNRYMLRSLLRKIGCKIVDCGSVIDTFEATVAALKKCAPISDLILTSGGVSVGEEDHIKSAIEHLGHLELWKVNIKPGKPLVFGEINGTKLLGLPGNPVSTYITFLLFGIPLIRQIQGQTYQSPISIPMPLTFDINKPKQRAEYLRVRLTESGIEPFVNQSSAVLTSVCWANALAHIPAGTAFKQGDLVDTLPLELFFN